MNIFDFNIHLYSKNTGTISTQIKSDTELKSVDLIESMKLNSLHFTDSGLTSANIMLFNEDVYLEPEFHSVTTYAKEIFLNPVFTILVNPNADVNRLRILKDKGITFIKFHCYVQQIDESMYPNILQLCKTAEELKLGICIDTSYGTTCLYKYDNLKLAAYLADFIKKAPIILLHSGGARVFDAMLIADHNPNIYLETSLSLNYYKGSSIMQDFAFAYKKIGLNRILFASDYPYQKVNDALSEFTQLCEQFGISDKDKENILYHNATKLISELS